MMIERIQKAVVEELPLQTIKEQIKKRENLHLNGFTGSSLSFLFKKLQDFSGSVLFITSDDERAAAVASDLQQLKSSGVNYFPSTRRKPYDDQRIPDLSVMVQRSEVLDEIVKSDRFFVSASVDAIIEKLVPAEVFNKSSILLEKGQTISPDNLAEQLSDQGYEAGRFVGTPGEYAIRGGIFDIYPFSGNYPVRIEFFGDEIDTIREFDPDSQRSVSFLNETRLVPNINFSNNGKKESLLSYLPENSVIVLEESDNLRGRIEEFFEEATESFNTKSKSSEELPPPEHEYLTVEEWRSQLEKFSLLTSGPFSDKMKSGDEVKLDSTPHPSFNGSFKLLRDFITEKSSEGFKTILFCEHENQLERFDELLGEPSAEFNYQLAILSLNSGFILNRPKLAILTDHQIFNRYHRPKIRQKKVRGGISLKELKDLNVGDYVVHVDYGIAKFAGFKKVKVRNTLQETAVLRYKDDSILYVNVSSLHKLQKYSGKEGKQPRITKLGSGEWARKKAATRKKVKDIARELITLYAKRKSQKAHAFQPDTSWQTEMEARFEYEETPDQLDTIKAVKKDLEAEQPMDRLICGDVGFGKTEVSIRAAFKAVMEQKQVAVLVPTTILADQHSKTFKERMKEFPVVIESLSRFRTAAEQKKVIKDLKAGKVDILIGTHRIVSKDVEFKDLGLLVIDEEQRFGVSVKEKLKKFRASVDVLTMTATPIPRTLQYSLMGARDLSIINTPPQNRQPVYTEIHSFDPNLIRDAIIQEISRGGQVFFINNRVKNIEEVAEMIRELVPDVRVMTAHGQMSASKLEKIIRDFYQHKFDVIVSTNIVENGIDISNANTIIINNANRFGLSELHQLRGRVGRSNRKAFCYLITPDVRQLSSDARKRLMALEEFSDLGSGFNIAMRDLDIRGAGDILGAEQSGFINDIGFELYTKILDDAVRELKETEFSSMFEGEKKPIDYPDTQVEFDYSAYLDNSYVTDNVERLNLYRKLSEADTMDQIQSWEEELQDRFGKLPDEALNLKLATEIKLIASRLLVKKVTIRSNRVWLQFPKNDSLLGKQFYDSGYFQTLLKDIRENEAHKFEVIQKNNTVTLVIHDLQTPFDAKSYLSKLTAFQAVNEIQYA